MASRGIGTKDEIPVKQPPEIYPIDPIWPPVTECAPGYVWNQNTQNCEAIDPVIDPIIVIDPPPHYDPICPAGQVWDPITQACIWQTVREPDPVVTVCPAGSEWDSFRQVCVSASPVYVDPIDLGDPPSVFDPITPLPTNGSLTPATTNPTTTTPGILDGLLDANGKIFGFEPIYVGIAAVGVFLLLFSGGGKR